MPELLDEFGEVNLDDVFPNPESTLDPNRASYTPPTTQTAPQVTPEEPFLKTATGTVYKSADDAVKGIEHKDALILKLRQDAIERTGIDPVSGQPVRKETTPVNYTQDGDRFLTDLAAAAKKGDTSAYTKVQEKFVNDVLAPYAPILSGFAKTQAVEAVAGEISDFRQFLRSDDMKHTLDENPSLRQAIEVAEVNPQAAGQLGEFYKMAYKLNMARKLPEAVRAQTATQTQARPTVSSATSQAPPSTVKHESPSFDTPEGRRAIIAEQEKRGVMELRF
jgi:hypothetical protein